jgi:pimeloyl-ACP methyl ester carboxylesterase
VADTVVRRLRRPVAPNNVPNRRWSANWLARTLLGQAKEGRRPYTRADAESIRVPTLFVGGEQTPGSLPFGLRALAAHVPDSRIAIIPNTTHLMVEQDPVRFSAVVIDFLTST